jgi:(p)ppGpp synthase/HD superfamily hydrolase
MIDEKWKENREATKLMCAAASLAEKAHRGQVRKGNGRDYITHPERVAEKIWEMMIEKDERVTANLVAAAWLHDVLEDTQTTEQEIVETTNEEVLKLVKELTNPSKQFVFLPEHKLLPKGGVRQLKKKMDREHLAHVSWGAKLIKLVDRYDNVSDMENMDKDFCLLYADESEMLLEALKGTDDFHEEMLKTAIENLRKRFA